LVVDSYSTGKENKCQEYLKRKISAINKHLKAILNDNELQQEAIIKKCLIVQFKGNRHEIGDAPQNIN
jgi:hypothetical protein